MKVVVNYPLKGSRLYLDDFIEDTIPNVGDVYDGVYKVERKTIKEDTCILDLVRMWIYE